MLQIPETYAGVVDSLLLVLSFFSMLMWFVMMFFLASGLILVKLRYSHSISASLTSYTSHSNSSQAILSSNTHKSYGTSKHSQTNVPGVSILRPLKGVDSNLLENLTSSFVMEYPLFEIIFSVASETDPAVNIVKQLFETYPNVDARLIIGEKFVGSNPKINNLVRGYEQAKYDIIWIMDSNVRIDPGSMARSVELLRNPSVGLIHHLPAIYRAENFGAQLEWNFINAVHARMYSTLNWVVIDSCIVGKSLVFRKSDLDKAAAYANSHLSWPNKHLNYEHGNSSGLAYFGQFMAEDNFIGIALMRIGLKHQMTHDLAVQTVGSSMTTKEYFSRRMRWIRTRLFAVPLATAVEPFTESILNGLLACWAFYKLFNVSPSLFLPIHFAIWLSTDMMIAKTIDPYTDGFPLLAWFVRELTALPLYMWSFCGSDVNWRGTIFKLNRDGTVITKPGKGNCTRTNHLKDIAHSGKPNNSHERS